MGVKEFFKNAFQDMKESAKAQHEVDKAEFQAAKAQGKKSWDDAHMSTSERAAVMQAEREEKIAAAKARTEAANQCYEAAKK